MRQAGLVALLVLGLAACAHLRDVPLDSNAALDLGAAAELSGTLHYRRGDGTQGRFLLALRLDRTALDLALVTPQAVPLYRVQAAGDSRQVLHKLTGQGEPDADELVRALRLMYGDPVELARLLRPGWTLRKTTRGRALYRGDAAPAVDIEYEGRPPWYKEVRLKDAGANTILTVRWLEY